MTDINATPTASQQLIQALFDCEPAIRYVALYQMGRLISRQREELADASASESDRYEELLVNPALLTLATQRGQIDCGGLRFLIVAYGNFYQLVRRFGQGHVSICIGLSANPIDVEERIRSVLNAAASV